MRNQFQKAAVLTAAVVGLAGCGKSTREYPGPWRSDTGPEFVQISATLAQNAIKDCGEFYFRLAGGKQNSGEALVACTRDGRQWSRYLVFYKIKEIARPDGGFDVPDPSPEGR